jgi:hypothetical protein
MIALFVAAGFLVMMVSTTQSAPGGKGYQPSQGPAGPSNVGNQSQGTKVQPGTQQGAPGNQGKLTNSLPSGAYCPTTGKGSPSPSKAQQLKSQGYTIGVAANGQEYWFYPKRK